MSRRIQTVTLAVILLVAAGTRLAGIDHHLRRAGPDFDEANNFVEPIQRMWAKRTPDPTVYTGYPGFFNWVAFLPVGLGQRLGGEVGAFTGGRILVALCSIASVGLAFVLGRRMAGPAVGLLAAALLAVSRGEIRASHYITPDVLVATSGLLILCLAARPKIGSWQAALLGGIGGLSVAVKYTGLFVVPAVVAAIAPQRRRLWLWLLAVVAAAAAFVVAAPYAVAGMGFGGEMGGGFSRAIADYFGTGYASNLLGSEGRGSAASVVWLLSLNLGVVGIALAVVGATLTRPWKAIAPAVAVVALGVAALVPAKLVYPRHVLAVSAVAAVLAALGVDVIARPFRGRRRSLLLAALTIALLAVPAWNGLRLAARYARTPAIDAAADWIEARNDSPWLVGTTLPRLWLDPDRFEVRSVADEAPREVLAHYPLLVLRPNEAAGWPVLARFTGVDQEQPLVIATPPEPRLAEPSIRWTLLADGLEGVAAAPFRVERIELEGVSPAAGAVVLEGRGPADSSYRVLKAWPLRPGAARRQRRPEVPGQIFIVTPPATLHALRVRSPRTAPSAIRILGPDL